MSARAMQLREGIAPTRDRLTTTVFMAALVHGVIIVGVTFSGGEGLRSGAPGLEVLIVSQDVPEARSNDTATYLAQRTQLGSGTTLDPGEQARAPRAAAEHAARDGRADGTTVAEDAGALMTTADNRVLTTSAPMPEILYFAPPASLTEMTEVPLLTDGNRERDRLGIDDEQEQQVRGPQRDELWVTPDTREALVAPYLVAWRLKVVHEHLPLATDPAAQAEVARAAAARRERCRSDLLTRYAACMSNLEAAETTAAHAVSGTLGEAVSPAGQRLLLLSQLPVSAVAARQAEAVALVDRVLSGVGTNPHGWSAQQIEQVVLALGDQLADPLVVRALMDRLGVDGLEHASRVLWHETDPMRTRAPTEGSDSARQALDLLARAFAGSVSEAPASDPASAALLDQWRAGWLGQLLSSTTSGLTAQLMLVSAAAAGPSRTVPGYGYAVGALRALLAGSGPLTPQFDLSGVYTNGRISADNLQDRDPYQLLLSSLGADPALARRVLLSEGTTGRTLLHELVVERPLQSASTADPLTSSAALGRLVLDLAEAPDSTSAAHAEFAGAFLDALGEAGQRWWDLGPQEAINVGRHLDALRQPGAVLLTADPARVHADAEAAQDGGSAQAARMRSLLGEITRDHDPTSGGLSAQSLRTLLEQLATFEARRLAQAMAAEPVNSDTVTNAQSRLGYVLGFTAEAATQAQIHAGEAEDALNRQQRELIGMSAEVISAAPLPGSGAVAKVAGVVGAVVVGLGAPALSDLYPVDNAELASNRRGPRVAEARALASQSARDALRDQFGSESARAAGLAASRAVEPGTDAVLTADSERDRAP